MLEHTRWPSLFIFADSLQKMGLLASLARQAKLRMRLKLKHAFVSGGKFSVLDLSQVLKPEMAPSTIDCSEQYTASAGFNTHLHGRRKDTPTGRLQT